MALRDPDDKAVIAALARKDHTEYDRLRADVAETLGIRVGTLDDKVETLRSERPLRRDSRGRGLSHLNHYNAGCGITLLSLAP